MNVRVQQLLANLRGFFMSLPPARRVLVGAVGLASMVVILGLAWWVQRPLYRPLFTNLAEQDAAAIVQALRDEKVPFELEDGGRAVLVPAERLYELRLSLASRGLPEGGGVGFEIFDKQSLGQTDFVQHLNYQRALQGELGRTIGQLGGVESARVHLALPERSLFVARDRRPSASVVVKLAPGRALSAAQVGGIVHLVSSSIEGMAPESVTVVDEGGRMLTREQTDVGDLAGESSRALEYQRTLERSAEERIESMLGTVIGRQGVIARVSARLDFSRAERTEERYDPDGSVLKTQQSAREESTGVGMPGGAAGTPSNLSNDPAVITPTPAPESPRSQRREESSSFELSKVTSRTIAPTGVVQQLSIAVLIDGTYKEENGQRVFVPRPDDELERLRELVKTAAGFSEERGDQIEVTSAPFQAPPEAVGDGMLSTVGRWAPAVLTRLLGVAFAIVVLLFIIRPVMTSLSAPRAPARRADGTFDLSDMGTAMAELSRENLQLTQKNPERAAQLVREWLHQDGSRSA